MYKLANMSSIIFRAAIVREDYVVGGLAGLCRRAKAELIAGIDRTIDISLSIKIHVQRYLSFSSLIDIDDCAAWAILVRRFLAKVEGNAERGVQIGRVIFRIGIDRCLMEVFGGDLVEGRG